MCLEFDACSLQCARLAVAKHKGNIGRVLIDGITDLDFVRVGYLANQLAQAIGALLGGHVSHLRRYQLKYCNNAVTPGTGIPTFYQFTSATTLHADIDLIDQLALCFLHLVEHL